MTGGPRKYSGVWAGLLLVNVTPRWSDCSSGPDTVSKPFLRTPQGLAADGQYVWVCDQGYPDVFRVDPASRRIRRFIMRAHRPASPIAVASDESGRVYVADAARRSVLVYGTDGNLQQELSDENHDQPFEPTAVLIDRGHLLVADRGGRRVARYDLASNAWEPSSAPQKERRLATPAGLALTADGVLLVTDAMLGAVHRVDGSGSWLSPVGRRGRGPGEMIRPIGICCTPSGLIAVADAARQAVVIFDKQGDYVMELSGGDEWRGWTLPMGVACLTEHPGVPGLELAAGGGQSEWIVVSDMLGEYGLTLISISTEETNVAAAKPEVP